MPTYKLLVNFDSDLKPTSLASIQTSYGAVVVLFRDDQKFSEAMETLLALHNKEAFQGRRGFGSYELEAGSIDEAVEQILITDPSLANETTFLGDDDPTFDELLDSLRGLAGL